METRLTTEPTEAEIRALYDQYGPVLFHRCRSILRNDEDANDAVQETFARVIRNWSTFRSESSPLTWMYRISTNYCLNQVRNRTGRAEKREVHREAIVGMDVMVANRAARLAAGAASNEAHVVGCQ